MAHSPPK